MPKRSLHNLEGEQTNGSAGHIDGVAPAKKTAHELQVEGFDAEIASIQQTSTLALSPARLAFLFTWNPSKWNVDRWPVEFTIQSERTRNGEAAREKWSTSGSKQPSPCDRAFLLLQSQEPRGIIGSGLVAGRPFEDTSWDDASKNETYVDIDFDVLLNREQVLPRRILLEHATVRSVHWDAQRSGTEIKGKPRRRAKATDTSSS